MRVSIIVRAYNEEEHFEKLLLGIQAQRRKPDEIVLVDSGSTDSTVEIGHRYGCRVVPIDKHEFTFGRALNRGCEAAIGDVCVFVSAHVYPLYNDWLEKLIAPFEDDRVVLTYGRQRGGDVNKFSEGQIFARWFPPHSTFPQTSYFCNNANAAIRRSTWESVPYDEMLTGLEDLAWAKAAQARGGLIAYLAEAEIVHLHDETWEQVQNRYRREAIAMRAIDEHAKFTRLDLGWLLLQHVLSDGLLALQQGILRREIGSILKFRYNQLLGTWRGFNGPPDVSAELRARFYYPTRPHHRPAQPATERQLIDYEQLRAPAGDEVPSATPPTPEPSEGDKAAAPTLRVVRGDR
jgi:glycosyltransferase involved in cell wall biosynthesis